MGKTSNTQKSYLKRLFTKPHFLNNYSDGNGSFLKAFLYFAIIPIVPIVVYWNTSMLNISKNKIFNIGLEVCFMIYMVCFILFSNIILKVLIRCKSRYKHKFTANTMIGIYAIILVLIITYTIIGLVITAIILTQHLLQIKTSWHGVHILFAMSGYVPVILVTCLLLSIFYVSITIWENNQNKEGKIK